MERRIHQVEQGAATLPKPLNVAAYCRVSSGKDAMLHSLSAQVSYYSEMIQNHPGWKYAGVYVDEAYTGTKDARPQFQRMLEDCRMGKIDRVITKSVSRFARNTVTLLETVRELKRMNVSVYFEEQHIDSMSGDGELMLTILASFAQEESKSVSDNCKWRIRKDFSEGKPMNLSLLFGYKQVGGEIEPDPDEASVVRRIFDRYIGGEGCVKIAEELRKEGLPGRFKGTWDENYVRKILKNEKYTGDALLQKTYSENHLTKRIRRNRGELPRFYVEGSHPEIIDHATYEKAQQIMDQNREKLNMKKRGVAHYPFSRLIVCGSCGAHFKRRTTRSRITWVCNTYFHKGKQYCASKQIPEEVLQRLTCEVLGIREVTEEAVKPIQQIVISGPNQVRFILIDGREVEKDWIDRSRSESWTDEMRHAASDKARKQHEKRKGEANE